MATECELNAEYGASLAEGNISLNVQMRTDNETGGVPAKTVEDGRTLDEQVAWAAQSADSALYEYCWVHTRYTKMLNEKAAERWRVVAGTIRFDSVGEQVILMERIQNDCSRAGGPNA